MLSPNIIISRFDSFCIYTDPYAHKPTKKVLTDSISSAYELRFLPEDWPGGLTVDGTFYPSHKGHFVLIRPGQKRRESFPYKNYFFYLIPEDPQLKEALDRLPTYAEHPQMDTILALCNDLKRVVSRNTVEARLAIFTILYQVLGMLFSHQYAVTVTPEGNPHRHQQALLDADRYLQEHIAEDVDLERLAKDSNLTPTYFHKLFTAAFKMTPAQQLQQYRHWAARTYLRDDDCPIAEVARKCGYSSQSYFCYIFKKREGITPSQYRKNRRYHRVHPLHRK